MILNKRGMRAIAPIFAALILIAITIVGGVVVYMYTSGYLSGMTGGGGVGTENVAVQVVEINDAASGNLTVYSKSIGGTDVVIDDVVLKDSGGNVIEVLTLTTTEADRTLLADGTLNGIDCDFDASLTIGNTYSITLITKLGNQFVSTSFKA